MCCKCQFHSYPLAGSAGCDCFISDAMGLAGMNEEQRRTEVIRRIREISTDRAYTGADTVFWILWLVRYSTHTHQAQHLPVEVGYFISHILFQFDYMKENFDISYKMTTLRIL